ncbi:unnamed protein product [Miscanthus lutarioriparius]|uniref:40S ribosomal protein S12 n=1 Tax=Miscanthus lutarioriparius TaxID=422564 RepID=A0A811RUJ4_9POAL|nr:unnamed protein product [Miscanthus lutarioriparius]
MADQETPAVVEAPTPVLGEPMDLMTALQLVMKKSGAHDGLVKGLREAAKAIEKHAAQLCVLAEDCDQPDYVKLLKALCAEHNVHLVTVPSAKTLGEWAGLCKIDSEGKARKVVGCSCVVVKVFAVDRVLGARETTMKFVAAYLLAVLAGNSSPSAEDLTAILESVGCEVDNERMELLLSQLSGKDITELIAAGREKFASVPCGGGGVAVAAAAPAAGGAAPAAEAKKEEKVEEKEESDDDMGFSLFD